ncbi:MAG: protein kinase, partial [candidate division Zixibacteria bacterium]|nr:protein kinase [candidate division Zixibacteria bacterium]
YAHKNGVIHRDIKPTNILIDRQGNAMVADFGIAQIIGSPETEMTSSDVIMGTLSYMSPEQKVSSTNVDQTTDIYAMGVIIYELLVGKKPLGRFKLPSELKPGLSNDFDRIISKCLAQEPKDRYQQAVELKDAILDLINYDESRSRTDEFSVTGSDSFLGKCRYLDTVKETRFSSTILVENRTTKKLYVIKKHSRGEAGRKEAKLLSSLKHENIINIFGSGGDRKTTVVISEYAQGGSLADRMVRNYNWEKAFKIILEVAAGLDHAHRNNIIHGNMRPSNVLLDADKVVKLCDFCMPPHYDEGKKKNWYSPPERKKSRQGDIYAMGVILHQMITGRNPSYDSAGNLRLDDIQMELPEDIANMIRKLLAIRVPHRYKTGQEFLLDYEDFARRRQDRLAKRIVEKKPPEPPAKAKFPVWGYGLLFLGFLAGMFSTLWITGFFK